jgi:hypothetical protein
LLDDAVRAETRWIAPALDQRREVTIELNAVVLGSAIHEESFSGIGPQGA